MRIWISFYLEMMLILIVSLVNCGKKQQQSRMAHSPMPRATSATVTNTGREANNNTPKPKASDPKIPVKAKEVSAKDKKTADAAKKGPAKKETSKEKVDKKSKESSAFSNSSKKKMGSKEKTNHKSVEHNPDDNGYETCADMTADELAKIAASACPIPPK